MGRQALLLVYYIDGTGEQIQDLAQQVQTSVEEKFGIRLMAEVIFL